MQDGAVSTKSDSWSEGLSIRGLQLLKVVLPKVHTFSFHYVVPHSPDAYSTYVEGDAIADASMSDIGLNVGAP